MNKAFEIIFEDDSLIVVNKIAKILVQPCSGEKKVTLTSLLGSEAGRKVFPCHRLDRETTGLIIYAKNRQVQKSIMDEFRLGRVEKKYTAFVKGALSRKKGVLESKIIDREGRIHGERPKKAKTFYWVLKKANSWSVVELKPLTGRTNQLRIQLAEIGHPILGESKYAFRRDFKIKFGRVALHAFYLGFIHPLSKKKISFRIKLPEDMRNFLKAQLNRKT